MLGSAAHYDRERALYTEDCLAFVKQTQPKVWDKFSAQNPANPDKAFLDRLAAQLDKADSSRLLRSTSGCLECWACSGMGSRTILLERLKDFVGVVDEVEDEGRLAVVLTVEAR